MHFDIIQLGRERVPAGAFITEECLYEDELINSRTNYYGDPKDFDKEADRLARVFKPFAKLDRKNRTITFIGKATLVKKLKKYVGEETKKFSATIGKKSMSCWQLQRNIDNAFDTDDLFFLGYGMTAMDLIGDYIDNIIPKTLHIGAVLDAHL